MADWPEWGEVDLGPGAVRFGVDGAGDRQWTSNVSDRTAGYATRDGTGPAVPWPQPDVAPLVVPEPKLKRRVELS